MLAPVTSFLEFEQNYRDAQSDYMTKKSVIKLNKPVDLKSFVEKYENSLLPIYKMNHNN